MKKVLLLVVLAFSFINCEKDNSDEKLVPLNIEGKWLFEDSANLANTMYEFKDGLRYTYYCDLPDGCDNDYWSSLTIDDAIPNPNEYTFDDQTLIIDLNFGNTSTLPLIFECDGDRISFQDLNAPDRNDLVRLGADLSGCN